MPLDRERCLRAARSGEPRFDGQFFTCVPTTGIYCRPTCPALPPRSDDVRFVPSAAAAQVGGYRACVRCRPDHVPGSPGWDTRTDLVARAVRLVADGLVDRAGVKGLAARLGTDAGHLEQLMVAELGVGPLDLARSHRVQVARTLIETTDLPISQVAEAAGFGSVRRFDATFRAVSGLSPTDLRRLSSDARSPDARSGAAGAVTVRLPFRRPLWPDSLFGHLVATAVPGVEEWRDGAYRRTLRLPHGSGTAALTPGDDHIRCTLRVTDGRDLPVAIARCRRLLDLDSDPAAIDESLATDPLLAPLVATAPGRRVPRTVDEDEMGLRAVLGQQVSTAAARTHAARLVVAVGEPVDDPDGGLTHLFPTAAAIAEVDPATLALPRSRRAAVLGLARALSDGSIGLDPGADRPEVLGRLGELPGLGPWTVGTIAMRALGDPDAFLPTDLGVRLAAEILGVRTGPAALTERAGRWRPWRAYAVQHLWAIGDHAINRFPTR